MDVGMKTRKRNQAQASTSQPPRDASKNTQASDDPINPVSLDPIVKNSKESNTPLLFALAHKLEKPQASKAKAPAQKESIENASTEANSIEMPQQNQKQSATTRSMNKTLNEETEKSLPTQTKDKKSPKVKREPSQESILDETKKEIELLFEIAHASASKGDYHQAINIYNKIVKVNEKSTPAWIAIGHCYSMLGDNYNALANYQQALTITPDSQKDEQLWYGIGLLYKKIADYKNAETSFINALNLKPNSSIKGDLMFNLGLIKYYKGEEKESIRLLTNSILSGAFPVDKIIEILCTVGQIYEEIDDMNEAFKAYKQALTLDENNIISLQCIGWLSFQLDKIKEALTYINKANLINEDDTDILYMKARCYLKQKQYSDSYNCLNKCLTIDGENSMFWCSLGILFAEMDQLRSAHECISNALVFDPKSPENFFNMGCIYELNGQVKEAVSMLDKAIEIQPNFQLAFTRKLCVLAQLENKDNSLLEIQFKHHKFLPKFAQELRKSRQALPPSLESQNLLSLHKTEESKSQKSLPPKEGIFSKIRKEGQENTGIKNKESSNNNDNKTEIQNIDLNLNPKKCANETPAFNKVNKTIEAPIVLRHDPKVFQAKEDSAQPKTGFKLTHRIQSAEEDPAPLKKLKTEVINPTKSSSPKLEKS